MLTKPNARLMRIAFLSAVCAVVIGASLVCVPTALADESQEAGGNWKRIDTEVVTRENSIEPYDTSRIEHYYQASELLHESKYVRYESDLNDDYEIVGEHIDKTFTVQTTCDKPGPNVLKPGETITFMLAVELTDYYRVRREGRQDTLESGGYANISMANSPDLLMNHGKDWTSCLSSINNLSTAAFWEKDGHQYATGSLMWPSGETATIALVRP